MTPEHDKIVEEALKLPAEARAALAGVLLESLEETDANAEEAWREEVRKRIADLDAGKETTVPWEAVLRRLAD